MRKTLALVLALVMAFSLASTVFAADFTTITKADQNTTKAEQSAFRDESKTKAPVLQNKTQFDFKANGIFYGGMYSMTLGEGNIMYDVATDEITVYPLAGGTMYAATYDATSGVTYQVYSPDNASFIFATVDDIETGAYTDIGSAPEHIIGMAKDYTTGNLYASGTAGLYTVDPDSGVFTKVADYAGVDDNVIVMTMDTAGQLYVITFEGTLFAVDKDTGAATTVGNTGLVPNYAQSLVFDHDTQTMYWFYYGDTGALYTVDPATAATEMVGTIGGNEIYGAYTIPLSIDPPDPVPVEGVELTPEEAELVGGMTLQLRATVLPTGAYIEDKTVTWESSDESVATVDDRGLVTAIDAGTATITVTTNDGGFTDTCVVSVISAEEYYRAISDAVNAAAYGEDGYYVYATSLDMPWTVTDVDGRGEVGVSGNIGMHSTVSYIANYMPIPVVGGSVVSWDWMVSSEANYDGLQFYVNGTAVTAITGETDWATAEYVVPETGMYTFQWGYVKDISDSAGQDIGMVDNISIEMAEALPLQGISVSPATLNMLPGNTSQLSVVYDPINAGNPNVTYSSSNEAVATVSETGLVTSVAEGTATITVTAEDGGHTATCVVTVAQPITIQDMEFHALTPGETYNFNLGGDSEIVDVNGTVKNVMGYYVDLEFGDGVLLTVSDGAEPYCSDSIMYVLNENFEQVAYNDDSNGTMHPYIKFIPEASGRYYILIMPYSVYPAGGNLVLATEAYTPIHVTGVELTPETLQLGRGRYATLVANLEPAVNDYPGVIWESSDESVVTITDDGVAYGVADGTATITVTTVDGGYTDTATVTVGEPAIPVYDDLIYAINIYDEAALVDVGFISYDPEGSAEDIESVMPMVTATGIYAGTYAPDGLYYAYEFVNMFFFFEINYHIFDAATFTIQNSIVLAHTMIPIDMTYDYQNDIMYATIVDQTTGYHCLGIIDPATGDIEEVAPFELKDGASMQTLAAVNNGTLYGIGSDGILYEVDPDTAMVTEINHLGFEVSYVQTMVYDNYRQMMYWFQMDADSSEMVVFDPMTGDVESSETLGGGCMEVTGAFIYADPATFPVDGDPVPVESVTVEPEEMTISVGDTAKLRAVVSPREASNKQVTWSSSHPGVVEVDNRGNITGVHAGTAYVTATTVDGGFTASALITVEALTGSDIPEGMAKVTLKAGDVWGDGTGYQMLLDADATAFEDGIIPDSGPLSQGTDVSDEIYAMFEYKIPEEADGALNTQNIVLNEEVSIFIEPGTYDWCITNPTPTGTPAMWIATNGRADNFEIVAGHHYSFEVYLNGQNDNTDWLDQNIGFYNPNPVDPFTVTFVNYDDSVLATYIVEPGEDAAAPADPVHPAGYAFLGWDTDFTNVQSDLTVKALFDNALPYDLGDVNRDDVVNTGDAALVLRYAVELAELDEQQLLLADYNADGKVDTGDAAGILRFAVGL